MEQPTASTSSAANSKMSIPKHTVALSTPYGREVRSTKDSGWETCRKETTWKILNETGWESMDWIKLAQEGTMIGYYTQSNEHSGSTKCGQFID